MYFQIIAKAICLFWNANNLYVHGQVQSTPHFSENAAAKKGQKCRNHCKKIAFETWAIIQRFTLGAIVARKLKNFETRWSFFSCPSVQKIIGRQLNSTVWTELCFAPLWIFFRGRSKATNKKLFEVHRNHHDVQAMFIQWDFSEQLCEDSVSNYRTIFHNVSLMYLKWFD